MTRCAVVPAAGRGSRLGIDVPKILAPIADDVTLWSVLRTRLLAVADRVHVVLSPAGKPVFDDVLEADPERARISTSVQARPLGMGDAVMGCASAWSSASSILVVWGDQVHVSTTTLRSACSSHGGVPRRLVLPVVALERPYVEYRFGPDGSITEVRESREGAACRPGGLSDVGTFVLSTDGLSDLWRAYVAAVPTGATTGEVNFLPFLGFLSAHGWEVRRVRVVDPTEARGINTPDELASARSELASVVAGFDRAG